MRRDGTVKVLDFGLAKIVAGGAHTDVANSPTVTGMATHAGVLLGTAAYMSPEQARGEMVDERTDLWAFGAVLYKMLTARRAFGGNAISDTLANVLRDEPDSAVLPRNTPASIRTLLRRCLAKERRHRLNSAAAARLEIEDAMQALNDPRAASATAPTISRRSFIGAALAVGAIAAATVWMLTRPDTLARPSTSRFTIVPSSGQPLAISGFLRDFAFSPDGRHIVYRSQSAIAGGPLVVRSLDRIQGRILDGVTNAREPFFSSDSRWIGFFDSSEIKKISLDGGAAITVCQFDFRVPGGASWGDDNTIVFATGDPETGLWRVSADGGEPVPLTTPDASQNEGDHQFPAVLPGGRGVLYTIVGETPQASRVAVVDTKTGRRTVLIRGATHAEYIRTGHLVYLAGPALHVIRFDLQRLQTIGVPMRVVDAVSATRDGRANYAVSTTGILAYVVPGMTELFAHRSLTWVDRSGREEPINAPPRAYIFPRLSPDGSKIAVEIREKNDDAIWSWDLARRTLTRIVNGYLPSWTPDGSRLIIQAPPNAGTIYWLPSNGAGTADRLTTTNEAHVPTSVTPDGTHVIAYQVSPRTARDVYRLRLPLAPRSSDASAKPVDILLGSAADETNGEVSPDGRYIAYQSNESGRFEIYLRTFPIVSGGRWQVSRNGGTRPAWARTSRELFYLDAEGMMTAVATGGLRSSLALGAPVTVFNTKYATPVGLRNYDVSADGQKFLMLKQTADLGASATLVVVLNWFEELNERFVAAK